MSTLSIKTIKNKKQAPMLAIRVYECVDKAISYMEKQEWAKALDGFKDVLTKNKRHTQSYGNMGICYFRLGEREQALAALDKALEIDPAYEPAIINRIAFGYSEKDKNTRQSELNSINYYRDYGPKKGSLLSIFRKIIIIYIKIIIPVKIYEKNSLWGISICRN